MTTWRAIFYAEGKTNSLDLLCLWLQAREIYVIQNSRFVCCRGSREEMGRRGPTVKAAISEALVGMILPKASNAAGQ
jgi:hypothetical protein